MPFPKAALHLCLCFIAGCTTSMLKPEFRAGASLIAAQAKKERAADPGIDQREAVRRAFAKLEHTPEIQSMKTAVNNRPKRGQLTDTSIMGLAKYVAGVPSTSPSDSASASAGNPANLFQSRRQKNCTDLCLALHNGRYEDAEAIIRSGDFDMYRAHPAEGEVVSVFESLEQHIDSPFDSGKLYKAPPEVVRHLIEACLKMEPNPNAWFKARSGLSGMELKKHLLLFVRMPGAGPVGHRDSIHLLATHGLDFSLDGKNTFLSLYGYSIGKSTSARNLGADHVQSFAPAVAAVARAGGGTAEDFKTGFEEGYERMETHHKPMRAALEAITLAAGAAVLGGVANVAGGTLQNMKDSWQRSSTSSSAAPATATSATTSESQTRFYDRFKGTATRFTVSRDVNADAGRRAVWITVRHPSTSKEFRLFYTVDMFQSYGIADDDKSLIGQTVEVKFNNDGHPYSIKNLSNGRTCKVTDWNISDYNW